MLELVKMALRVTTNAYDLEIQALIDAAMLDLGVAGVTLPETLDAICQRAVITYCKMHFGEHNPEYVFRQYKESYDEQKAQLSMATGYTTW